MTVTLRPQHRHSSVYRALVHLGPHLSLQCVWRACWEERGGEPPFCPVSCGCLLGVLAVICSQGLDHWRQGSHTVPTMQLQRGAPRPGISPGLVLPGSGSDGSQKGEEEAANMGCHVGSVQQPALTLTQARWETEARPSHLPKARRCGAHCGLSCCPHLRWKDGWSPQAGLTSCW